MVCIPGIIDHEVSFLSEWKSIRGNQFILRKVEYHILIKQIMNKDVNILILCSTKCNRHSEGILNWNGADDEWGRTGRSVPVAGRKIPSNLQDLVEKGLVILVLRQHILSSQAKNGVA
jgi:hypothetical protein